MTAILDAAREYLSYGWTLCKIRPGTKEPLGSWTGGITDLAALQDAQALGVVLEKSGIVCLDIDDLREANIWAESQGLKSDLFSGWRYQGSKQRVKVLFSVDAPLRSLAKVHGIEWRSAGRYDVLPPSPHPDGHSYAKMQGWVGDKPPPLPDTLRAIWMGLLNEKPHAPQDPLAQAALSGREYREDYDFELIRTECQAIRYGSEHPTEIDYAEWMAVATIAVHCADGDAAFQTYSALDEARYSPEHTTIKLHDARQMGPRTCANWPNPARCTECRFKGQITSPLHVEYALKRETEVKLRAELPDLPEPFAWKDGKVVFYTEKKEPDGTTKEVPITLFRYPVWVKSVGYTKEARSQSLVEIVVDGTVRNLEGRQLTSTNFEAAMTEIQAPLPVNPEAAKMARRYIMASINDIVYSRRSITVYQHYGWQEGLEYLHGNLLMRPGTPPEPVVIPTEMQRFKFTRRGSLRGWVDAAKVFFQPGLEGQSLTMLSGLSTPLLKLVESADSGYTLSLYSPESGQGKSTVQRAVGTAIGEQRDFISMESDTVNARTAMAALLHSYPILMEEFSSISPDALQQQVFASGSGMEKQRLDKNASLRSRGEQFFNTNIISSNRSLLQLLGIHKKLEAASYRVMEIRMRLPKDVPYIDGSRLVQTLENNCGNAYPYVVQMILDNAEAFKGNYYKWVKRVAQDASEKGSAMRFRIKAVASMMTLAEFAMQDDYLSRLGIDLGRLLGYAIKTLDDNRIVHIESYSSSADMLRDYVTQSMPSINITGKRLDHMGNEIVTGVIKAPMEGRGILGRIDETTRIVYLAAGPLKAFVSDQNRDWRGFLQDLEEAKALHPRKYSPTKLSAYLVWDKQAGVVEHCYLFNLDFFNIDLAVLQAQDALKEMEKT